MQTTMNPAPPVFGSNRAGLRLWVGRFAALAIVALLGVLSAPAHAAVSNCTTSSAGSFTLADALVSPTTTAGTAIGSPVQVVMTFSCTNIPGDATGADLNIQVGGLATRDPYATGSFILFDTSIPGIALRIIGSDDPAGSQVCQRCGPFTTAGFEIGPIIRTGCTGNPSRCTGTITETFTAQLVKTGTVTPGTLNGLQLAQFWWYEYGYTASSGPLATALTVNGGTQVRAPGCTVNAGSKDFTVTLPTVGVAALPALGSTAGRTRFNINLTCVPGTNVTISFDPSASFNDAQGIIRGPTSGGTNSRGIGIQLINGAGTAPVPLNAAVSLGVTPSAAWSVPFHAQYYRTNGGTGTNSFRAGNVTASAQFTLTYK